MKAVSIICSTNKKDMKNNILKNFLGQDIKHKELIVILNYRNPDLDSWRKDIIDFPNVQVFYKHPNITLGECLNFAVEKSKYPIIAKFDDDDYYGPNYLTNSLDYFDLVNADIIGKSTTYVYFKEYGVLALKNENYENVFVNRVEGSTLIFKKSIFHDFQFQNKNLGEDVEFCRDGIKHGYKIFSSTKDYYVNIRDLSIHHTWKINNKVLLNYCKEICKTSNFKDYLMW